MPKQTPDDQSKLTTLALNIRFWRKQKSWSQTQLAEKVKVHLTHISKLENAATLPALDVAERLAEVFSTTIEGLSKLRPEPGSEEAEAAQAGIEVTKLRGRSLNLIKQCLLAIKADQSVSLTVGRFGIPIPRDEDALFQTGEVRLSIPTDKPAP